MTYAQTVYEWLTSDPAVAAELPAERWYGRGAVVDTPETPWGLLVHLSTIRLGGGRDVYPMQVAVHDEPGSYVRIDMIQDLVVVRLKALAQFTGAGGVRVVQADYLGRGGEETDPDRRTIYKMTNWQLAVGGTDGA